MSEKKVVLRRIDLAVKRFARPGGVGLLRRKGRKKDRSRATVDRHLLVAEVLTELRNVELARHRYQRESGADARGSHWTRLRYEVLVERGGRCECCGATAASGKTMHVDHIKPVSKFPHLALEKSNLQVLCQDCNLGKSDVDQTDWRPKN